MPYTTVTVIEKDPPLPDGRVWLTVEFTGEGETPRRSQRYIAPGDTALSLHKWAIAEAANFGAMRSIVDSINFGAMRSIVDSISVNQTFNLTPPAGPTPSAEEVWRGKVSRYSRLHGLGFTGQIATDLATLKADIEATYDSTYL